MDLDPWKPGSYRYRHRSGRLEKNSRLGTLVHTLILQRSVGSFYKSFIYDFCDMIHRDPIILFKRLLFFAKILLGEEGEGNTIFNIRCKDRIWTIFLLCHQSHTLTTTATARATATTNYVRQHQILRYPTLSSPWECFWLAFRIDLYGVSCTFIFKELR